MSVVIRPRTEEDIPDLADVLVRVHAQDGYPVEGVADPESWLRSDRMLGAWVAELDGRPVGQVMVTAPGQGDQASAMLLQREEISSDDVAVLCRLFIDPKARGERISSQLIFTAEKSAREAGRRLVLDVMKKDAAAIAVYQRLGWEDLGEFDHIVAGKSEPARIFASLSEKSEP